MYVSEPSNPAKVKVSGPGVEKGVKTFTPTYFIVDCKEAGPGKGHERNLWLRVLEHSVLDTSQAIVGGSWSGKHSTPISHRTPHMVHFH